MFKDYCHEYLENGFKVIPLNGKRPMIKDWTNIPINEKQLDDWCTFYPKNNIGLLCGKKSGIIAIDIDKDSALKLVPQSPVVRKGKKGEVRFFKYNGEKSFKRHDLGIELLSDGAQVVLPPSIHPETKRPYVWTRGSLLDANDLPDLSMSLPDQMSFTPSGRHDTLIKFCGGKIEDGIDATTAVQELIDYDEQNHAPPYFTDKSEAHKGSGYLAAMNLYTSVLKTVVQKGNFVRPTNSIITIGEETKYKKSFKKLPKLEGVGQAIFEDLYKNSPIPRTQLCFMNTMNLLSIMIGTKLFHRGTACNLYQYGVAPSGYGKDFSFKRSKQILVESNLKKLLGPTSPTSESVVLATLEGNREKVFFINEAESILKRITDDRKNNGLRECLTDLYDYGGKMHTAKETMAVTKKDNKKTDEIGEVFSPFINILMTSTISAFEKYASEDIFNTGFGSRFLFYFEDRFKDENYLESYSPPISSKLIDGIKQIANCTKMEIDLSSAKTPFELEHLNIPTVADKTYRDIFEEIKIEKREYADSRFLPLVSRKLYFINKFATIHHVMLNPFDFISAPLSSKSYHWAKKAVDSICFNMVQHLDDAVSETAYGKTINKFIKYIKGRTDSEKGTTKQDIGKRFAQIKLDERRKLVADLADRGVIKTENNKYYYVQ